MARVEQRAQPYAYPGETRQRRHGPAGYEDYHSYRPWLEDEFTFRCVYCLKRIVWAPSEIFAIDHLISLDEAPHRECDYDNLVFACQFCNQQKGPNRVPDPCRVAYGACLRVEPDGTITPLNDHGRRLEKVLRLNHQRQVDERRKTIQVLIVLARNDQTEYERWMGFPSNLPDLTRKAPPRNLRPGGVADSFFAKRQRGELPRIY